MVVWFSGCKKNCYNCQNQELRNSEYGYLEETKNVVLTWKSRNLFYDSIVFLGGEPLDQEEAVYEIISNITGLKWLYTGFYTKEISERIMNLFDIIISEPYIDELKTNSFPASSNQKILYHGEIINADRNQLRERIRTTL